MLVFLMDGCVKYSDYINKQIESIAVNFDTSDCTVIEMHDHIVCILVFQEFQNYAVIYIMDLKHNKIAKSETLFALYHSYSYVEKHVRSINIHNNLIYLCDWIYGRYSVMSKYDIVMPKNIQKLYSGEAKFLVSGFLREFSQSYNFPIYLQQLILNYYPLFI